MGVLIVGLIAVGLWIVWLAFVIRKSKTEESQRILREIRAKGVKGMGIFDDGHQIGSGFTGTKFVDIRGGVDED